MRLSVNILFLGKKIFKSPPFFQTGQKLHACSLRFSALNCSRSLGAKQPRSHGSLLFVFRSKNHGGTGSRESWKRSWEPPHKFETGLLKMSFAVTLSDCSHRSCDTQLSCVSSTSYFLLLIISIRFF